MPLDPNEVVLVREVEGQDQPVEVKLGHVAVWRLRSVAKSVVVLIEGEDGPTLRRYHEIKRPNGEDSATLATRRAAWLYLLKRAARLASGPAWYMRLG